MNRYRGIWTKSEQYDTAWVHQRRSYLTNLLETLDDITTSIDEGIDVDVIYLDFSKVFDNEYLTPNILSLYCIT